MEYSLARFHPPSQFIFGVLVWRRLPHDNQTTSRVSLCSLNGGYETLCRYRTVFRHYTEDLLLIASFLYCALSAFSIAVFLVKYKMELILTGPIFALLFSYYLHIGLKKKSIAQTPEHLFKDTRLLAILAILIAAIAYLSVTDLPTVDALFQSKFNTVNLGD